MCKISFLKKIGIQLSRRLKIYMLEICQNIQKVHYQGAEQEFFQFLVWALVLINVNVGL